MNKTFDKISFVNGNGEKTTFKVLDSEAARKVSDFQMAQSRSNILSGDSYNTIYAKLSKWYTEFKPVVFSGSYNDLEDKPSIPTVNNGVLTFKVNGNFIDTFSANAPADKIINISIPVIDDNQATYSKLFSSQHILDLLAALPTSTSGSIDESTINSIINSVVNEITEQIERGEIEIPSTGGEPVDIDIFDDSIESNTKTWHSATIAGKIKNGKLTIKVNGQNALTYNGAPVAYYSANQQEDYELNLTIPDFLVNDATSGNNVLWSSSKVISYVGSHSSFRTEVVQNLPNEGEANVLYLVVKTANGQYDTHDEYIWINNTWENIGKQVVDMSSFNYRAGSDKVIIDNVNRTIDIDPTKLPQPVQYSGENGIIVDNNTHIIKLENGVIPQEPETPSNYYQYNNLNIVVPQGRGIIRLAHDYILPSGANPAFYDRGIYIEDPSVPAPPATARRLEYMTVMVQHTRRVPVECPLFNSVSSHGNSVYPHEEYYHPQQFNIPINAAGRITQDNNINGGYPVYDEVFRNGDFCYDNLGNLYTLDNIRARFSSSTDGSDVAFYIVPKFQAYDNENHEYFTTNQFQSWDYYSSGSVNGDYDYVVSGSEINGQHLARIPNNMQNYYKSYQFISAYKSPTTDKVFYLYGTPDESIALACYLREMDNGNIRPAFAGFLLFGTPWSIESPIERNNTELEIAASTWIEPRPQIMFIEASSINNAVANIGTSSLQADDIIVVKNPGATLTFPNGNNTITLYDIPFEPMFRWTGTEFKPMFYIIK